MSDTSTGLPDFSCNLTRCQYCEQLDDRICRLDARWPCLIMCWRRFDDEVHLRGHLGGGGRAVDPMRGAARKPLEAISSSHSSRFRSKAVTTFPRRASRKSMRLVIWSLCGPSLRLPQRPIFHAGQEAGLGLGRGRAARGETVHDVAATASVPETPSRSFQIVFHRPYER